MVKFDVAKYIEDLRASGNERDKGKIEALEGLLVEWQSRYEEVGRINVLEIDRLNGEVERLEDEIRSSSGIMERYASLRSLLRELAPHIWISNDSAYRDSLSARIGAELNGETK